MGQILDLTRARRIWHGGREIESLRVGGAQWQPPPPTLSDFYGVGPGKIAIHLSTDGATVDGDGNVTAITNQGGAGVIFDAVLKAAPAIPTDGLMLDLAAEGGILSLANAASIDGVRLMFVADFSASNYQGRIFGISNHEIRLGNRVNGTTPPLTAGLRLAQRTPGVDVVVSGYFDPASLRLYEIELDLTAGAVSVWIDGVISTTAPPPDLSGLLGFNVQWFGRGWGSNVNKITCKMGDVLGVTLGAGADAAIHTARQYLAARHGIALP